MRLYRACALVVSLAAVTAIAVQFSPAAGSASASRTTLLSLRSSAGLQGYANPSLPAPRSAAAEKAAPDGEMMRALSGILPLNEGAQVGAREDNATGGSAPGQDGPTQDGEARDAGRAGESVVLSDTSADGGDSRGGTEGAPIDDRKLAQILAAYHSQLVQLIEGQKRYPQIARKLGHQGIVQLKFTLSQDGRVVSSQVSSSSGFAELDDGAIQALRAVPRFPAFPTELGPANRPFRVSLSFTLN